MTHEQDKWLKRIGVDTTPKKDRIVNISREDFNLLDATEDGVTYYITEPNGSITMMRGDNR